MHNNTLILPISWYLKAKLGVFLRKFHWKHFKVLKNSEILVYFSEISENTRPKVAFTVKFAGF